MGNLAVWLMSLVGPLARKVLLMLGLGTVTYAALTPLVNSIIANAQGVFGQVGGAVGQILSLAGFPDALGIISGALVAKVTFVALGRIGKVTS
ncbi:hypothetical protein MASR1M60_19620 [Rhodocyclaceae bacterium]